MLRESGYSESGYSKQALSTTNIYLYLLLRYIHCRKVVRCNNHIQAYGHRETMLKLICRIIGIHQITTSMLSLWEG